jgi:hypothetical protein
MKEAKFTKPLTVAMQPGVYEQIKQITDEKRISMAQWVREIAEKALSNYPVKEESDSD